MIFVLSLLQPGGQAPQEAHQRDYQPGARTPMVLVINRDFFFENYLAQKVDCAGLDDLENLRVNIGDSIQQVCQTTQETYVLCLHKGDEHGVDVFSVH
eukprot:XP_001708134.1 Hypothetical protein GL50803_35351 [Giardia lamblia ATCC 50803]